MIVEILRDALIRKLAAPVETLDQVHELRSMLLAWMENHPDDEEVLGYGECLKMVELWLRQEKVETIDQPEKPVQNFDY